MFQAVGGAAGEVEVSGRLERVERLLRSPLADQTFVGAR